jgi:hypothetical protein
MFFSCLKYVSIILHACNKSGKKNRKITNLPWGVEVDHPLPKVEQIYKLSSLHKVETK